MSMRTQLFAAAGLAAALASGAASAAPDFNIGINVGPPQTYAQVMPAPRVGYVWAPGYWVWNGRHRAWIDGRWVVAQPYAYGPGPGRWETRRDYWRRGPGYYGHDRRDYRGYR